MKKLPADIQSQLNDCEILVHICAQEKALEQACEAGKGIQLLFDNLAVVRHGHDPFEIQDFNPLINACKGLFLDLAKPGSRTALLATAAQYAQNNASGLAELEPIAAADLLLRKLEILCIESAANQYPGETRSAGWDSKIRELQSTLIEVEKAWRSRRPSAN